MARSVNDIILRVLGQTEAVEKDIEVLAADLVAFSKISAEAEATVETAKARADIQNLLTALRAIDGKSADAKVNVAIAEAIAELEIADAEFDKVDGRNLEVDIDVQRGAFERIAQVTSGLGGLIEKFRSATSEGQSLGEKISGLRLAFGPLAGNLPIMAAVMAALIPIIVSLGAAIVALGASLGAAIAGLGALAVAAGGVLLPALGLVFAGIARFKEESGTAGTAANDLKNAFSGIGDAAKQLLPAVDPVFRALATGITALKPVIAALAPAFREFGQAAGDAVGVLAKQLASPAVVGGLQALISGASKALAPLASIAGSIFRIFLNIANAAMPFLTKALAGLAGGIKGFADATGNIGALRGVIGGLVSQLSSWLNLMGSVAGVFLELGKIAAPFGKQIVDSFTKSTEGIRNFLKSAEGSDRVKQFFADVIPLAQALVPLIAQIALVFIEVGQALAPALTPMIQGLTMVLQAVNFLLEAFNSLPGPVRQVIVALLLVASGVGLLATGAKALAVALPFVAAALQAIGSVGGTVINALVTAFNAVKSAVSAVAPIVAAIAMAFPPVRAAVAAVGAAFRALPAVASAVWGAIKGIFGKQISMIISVPRDAIKLATQLWGAVSGIIKKAISFIINLPQTAKGLAHSLWSAVSGIIKAAISFVIHLPAVGGLRSAAAAIWNAVKSALPDITIHIHIPTPSIPHINLPGGSLHEAVEIGDVLAEKWTASLSGALDEMATMLTATLPPVTAALSPAALATPGVPAAVVAGAGTVNNFNIDTPAGEAPDTDTMLAQIEMRMRSRGIW